MNNICITPLNLWEQMLKKKHLLNYLNGFTIPFVVGAYYKRGFLKDDDLQTSQCIRFILTNIHAAARQGEEPIIFKCGSREKLVLQYITDGERTKADIETIKQFNHNIDRIIYLDLDVFTHPYTLDTLTDKLWSYYHEPITKHAFSDEKGSWQLLNENELEFILNM